MSSTRCAPRCAEVGITAYQREGRRAEGAALAEAWLAAEPLHAQPDHAPSLSNGGATGATSGQTSRVSTVSERPAPMR